MNMSLSGMPLAFSSSSSTGRKWLNFTQARVMSLTTMPTLSPGFTTSLSGGLPIGLASASFTAAATSVTGG